MKSKKIFTLIKSIKVLALAIITSQINSCSSETHTTIKEIEKLDNIMEKTQHTFDSIKKKSKFEFERIESMKFDSTVNVDTIIITTEEY